MGFFNDGETTLGFGGAKIIHSKQAVMTTGNLQERSVSGLSGEIAASRGFDLVSIEAGRHDPYVLYNRWGQIVHQWPDEYVPDFVEVREVCNRLQGGLCQ